jgi:protein O-GlcNAc transferase
MAALYRRAALSPDPLDSNLVRTLAFRLRDAERYADGLRIARLALERSPADADLHQCAGVLHNKFGEVNAAIRRYRTALALEPANPYILNSLGVQLVGIGHTAEGIALLTRAVLLEPGSAEIHSNLLLCRQYDGALNLADQNRYHRVWFDRFGARQPLLVLPPRDTSPYRILKVGYVSADFGRHPVGFFLRGVIPRHDRAHFDVHCYSVRRHTDPLTREFEAAADHWHAVADVSPDGLADRIREDGIDILVDLAGHTADNRLLTFLRKPAPIQATWAGYVGTTGLGTMDYLISDARQTPPGVDEHFVERIVRLPDCYVCYEAPPYAPDIGELPVHSTGRLTFGCFNNLAKIDRATIALWAELLRRNTSRRLRLVTFALADPEARARIATAFAQHGIGAGQLELIGPLNHIDLLNAYNGVDIALDPLAYSGGLTTLEALWMGVPVVTRPSDRFCTRHSAAHLTAVGLPDLITDSDAGYLDRIEHLAADPDHLAHIRATLRPRMAGSPVCDAESFTRNLDRAYRRMWQRWCLLND